MHCTKASWPAAFAVCSSAAPAHRCCLRLDKGIVLLATFKQTFTTWWWRQTCRGIKLNAHCVAGSRNPQGFVVHGKQRQGASLQRGAQIRVSFGRVVVRWDGYNVERGTDTTCIGRIWKQLKSHDHNFVVA